MRDEFRCSRRRWRPAARWRCSRAGLCRERPRPDRDVDRASRQSARRTDRALAVDNSTGPHAGDVYVLDNGAGKVVAFTAAGAFRTSWGKNVNEGTGDPNICSSAGAPENICKPGDSSAKAAPTNGQQLQHRRRLLCRALEGRHLRRRRLADRQKFDPSGHLVTSFGGSPVPGCDPGQRLQLTRRIAVDSSGVLYVLVENTLTKYSENGSRWAR